MLNQLHCNMLHSYYKILTVTENIIITLTAADEMLRDVE